MFKCRDRISRLLTGAPLMDDKGRACHPLEDLLTATERRRGSPLLICQSSFAARDEVIPCECPRHPGKSRRFSGEMIDRKNIAIATRIPACVDCWLQSVRGFEAD